jgi:hypothetical protein
MNRLDIFVTLNFIGMKIEMGIWRILNIPVNVIPLGHIRLDVSLYFTFHVDAITQGIGSIL